MMAKEIKMTVCCQQQSEDIVVPSYWSVQRLMEELGNLFGHSLTHAVLRSETKEMILASLDRTLAEYCLSQGECIEVLEGISDEARELSI